MDTAVEKIEFVNEQAARAGGDSIQLTSGNALATKLEQDRVQDGGEDAGMAQTVYEWHVNKLPAEQVVPAATVRELAIAYFTAVVSSRQRAERKGWADAQHRDAVLAASPAFTQLAHTHPHIILMLSAKDVTERKLQVLFELIELRERQEAARLTTEQRQAQVSQYFMSNFVRPALPGEEEEAVRNGTGLRAEMVRRPAPSSSPA